MFADFRVHGLNTTFFQCFHHRGLRLLTGKEKGGASPISFNPCTRKSANMGHPSREQGLVASRESGGRIDSRPKASTTAYIAQAMCYIGWDSLAESSSTFVPAISISAQEAPSTSPSASTVIGCLYS
jgi:hypothetical protein